jgi:hypothetical protein
MTLLLSVIQAETYLSVIGGLLLMIVSMISFWLISVQHYVKREDVEKMIDDTNLTRDEVQDMIEESNKVVNLEIKHLIQARDQFTEALKDNTNAINELKLAIVELKNANK